MIEEVGPGPVHSQLVREIRPVHVCACVFMLVCVLTVLMHVCLCTCSCMCVYPCVCVYESERERGLPPPWFLGWDGAWPSLSLLSSGLCISCLWPSSPSDARAQAGGLPGTLPQHPSAALTPPLGPRDTWAPAQSRSRSRTSRAPPRIGGLVRSLPVPGCQLPGARTGAGGSAAQAFGG